MNGSISWKREDGLGHLVWNDPPGNEMTRGFFQELKRLVRDVLPSSGIEALLVYGRGRHFSSGSRVDELIRSIGNGTVRSASGDIESYPPDLYDNIETFRALENMPFPVVAALSGACLGSALELALHCHVRICGAGSALGLPESTFNLMPGCGGIRKTLTLAGRARAIELLLGGGTFSAEEALSWGIVDLVVPKKEVLETAVKTARRLSSRIDARNPDRSHS